MEKHSEILKMINNRIRFLKENLNEKELDIKYYYQEKGAISELKKLSSTLEKLINIQTTESIVNRDINDRNRNESFEIVGEVFEDYGVSSIPRIKIDGCNSFGQNNKLEQALMQLEGRKVKITVETLDWKRFSKKWNWFSEKWNPKNQNRKNEILKIKIHFLEIKIEKTKIKIGFSENEILKIKNQVRVKDEFYRRMNRVNAREIKKEMQEQKKYQLFVEKLGRYNQLLSNLKEKDGSKECFYEVREVGLQVSRMFKQLSPQYKELTGLKGF